jgi:hypothetical protein
MTPGPSVGSKLRHRQGRRRTVRRRTLIRDAEAAREFAADAYVYLYPLVLMDAMRRRMTRVAPANVFAHVSHLPSAGLRDVVRPSLDALHSYAWLDVSRGPVLVSVPDACDGYYLLPGFDMWSDLVAVPGTRTSGNWPADYAVVGPGWEGELPDRVRRIDAPTPFLWLVGHVQPGCRCSADFRSRLTITPFTVARGGGSAHGPDVDAAAPPVEQVDALTAAEFFARGAELMALHPPHVHDHAVLQRLERVGIVAGEPFETRLLPRTISEALPAAVARARFEIHRRWSSIGPKRNGWLVCSRAMGSWGADYLKRAAVARFSPGAVTPEDVVQAVALSDGLDRPLDGSRRYTLRFAAQERPPVLAFWSLTAYDEDGYVVPNELDRYAIGSRDELEVGADGSLELAIQYAAPGQGPAANWLPCPPGRFNLCLRLYRPERDVLEDAWAPPALIEREQPGRSTERVATAAAAPGN